MDIYFSFQSLLEDELLSLELDESLLEESFQLLVAPPPPKSPPPPLLYTGVGAGAGVGLQSLAGGAVQGMGVATWSSVR